MRFHTAARRCFRRGDLCVCPLARVSTNPWGATTSARHPPAGMPPGAGRFFGGGFAGFLSEAPPAPPTRPGHRFLSERKRWERKGRGCAPGVPPNGGSWRRLAVRTGQNRACIAARFMGSHVSGAVAPWVARIAVTPQALGTCALYRVRPPGRRRCYASEKAWRFPGGRLNTILHLASVYLAKAAGTQDLHRPGCPPPGGLFSPH